MKLNCLSLILLFVLIFQISCAHKRPVFYPNEKLNEVGQAQAVRDIDECLNLSSQAGLNTNRAGTVAKKTAQDATVGAVVGGAVGAVTGDFGEGVAIGAAGGGASGFIRGLFGSRDLDPLQTQFVNQCLADKGYRVIGWK
jgi:hypothetical protein